MPTTYLELLDSAFGTAEDGDELFAKFLNTLQDAGEKPSQYLYRLQTGLAKALKRLAAKRKQLKEKQSQWESQIGSVATQPLN